MKIKSLLSAFFILALNAGVLLAQNNIKIGYTDPEYILQQLPEYKQIESELKTYEKQLQAQIDNKMKDYQTKLEAYQQMISNPNGVPDVVRQDKEKELLGMQSNIKEFEESALSSLQKKQAALLDPAINKVEAAIKSVAEENGYTYIFNSSAGGSVSIILFAKNKDEDISALVLKKLGVSAPATNQTGAAPGGTAPAGTGTTTAPAPGTTTPTAPVKKK